MSKAAIIQDVKHLNIHNGRFIIDNRRTTADIQALPQGMKTLLGSGHISWTSLYTSDIRMTEANDLAVRDAVAGWRSLLEYKTTSFDLSGADDAINAIFSWVADSTANEPLIMWVHDDDRRKTSFIAQVVASLLAEHQLLSATYFFDEHSDRNSLVPTLIHGFTTQPKFREDLLIEILMALDYDPVGVFKVNHREQLRRLLVDPLRIVSRSYQPDPQHQPQHDIILLHAFEDCNNDVGFQESFLDALSEALISIKHLKYPQRLLVIGRRTDHLEGFFMGGKLASRSPILQRPVQSQFWLRRDQDIRQRTMELKRREEEIRLFVEDKEEKMRQEQRKKLQEVAEREKLLQERENKVREKEEFADQMSKKEKRIQQLEKALRSREIEIKTKEEELGRAIHTPATTESENIRQPTRTPTSPTSPGLQSPLVDSPTQERLMQEDARMISPAQVAKTDRVIVLMGPLVPHKRDFIDCLTHCVNTWRLHPSTKTSDQFFDSHSLGKGRFWVKAVRTQRQSHNILFVDFPSLGDDDLAAAKILENIATWLKEIRDNEIAKIAGILYFHPFESDWQPSHHNLRALGQICGDKAARKVIFVCEEPSSLTPPNAEAFFYQNYGNLMKGLGASFANFDNTAASGWRIVDRLLGPQSGDVSLFLQEELFVLRRPLHETYAGRQLYSDLILKLRKKLGALEILPRRSNSTDDQCAMIWAELDRLQRQLRHSKPSRTRESEILAKPVDFPTLTDL